MPLCICFPYFLCVCIWAVCWLKGCWLLSRYIALFVDSCACSALSEKGNEIGVISSKVWF
jgi:hypothetical protein